MEKMYQDYKDVVEFRLIYIREAHAVDSDWPMPIARDKGIKQHKNYDERCTTAKMLMDDESLTMPMLIDGMSNATNEDYSAYPDRVFLVRSDGRLAVAAERGPWGFNPGLKATLKWLADFNKSGEEPALSEETIAKADATTVERQQKRQAALATNLEKIAGTWTVSNVNDDRTIAGEVILSVKDGIATGQAGNEDHSSPVENLRFNGRQLSFSVTANDTRMEFAGEFDGEKIAGELNAGDQTFESNWIKK